jgi:hypothetical protein
VTLGDPEALAMTRHKSSGFTDGVTPWPVAIALGLATLLAACGHRELKAPCAPSDGASLVSAYASADDGHALALIPVVDLAPGAPDGLGPIPVGDPCGPLKPLNGGPMPQPALARGALR